MGIIDAKGKESYKGLVIGKREKHYDLGYDTTYYALVWDWSTLKTKLVNYADTRCDHNGTCQIDASPEVLEAYKTYQDIIRYNDNLRARLYETKIPKVGFTCLVVKGRLIKKGTVLTIKKTYETGYGVKFIGIDSNGQEHKSYIKNLEVIAVPMDHYLVPLKKPSYNATLLALYGKAS